MRYFCNFLGFTPLTEKNGPIRIYISHFILSICIIFAGYGFAEAQTPPPGTSKGRECLLKTIQNLLSLKTIEASIRMEIVVDEKEFVARGKYEEQARLNAGPGVFQRSMYRFDLNFQMDVPTQPGSEPNRMTIVCHPSEDREKDRIWQYTSVEGKKRVSFVRIALLEDRLKAAGRQVVYGTVGEVQNLGGITGQLRQIDIFYDFSNEIQSVKLEGSETQNVWKLVGTIKQRYLDSLLPAFGGLGKKKKYPPHMPTDIELYIGQDDGFPCRILYLNRYRDDAPKRIVLSKMTYYDVVLNGPEIPESHFATFEKDELPEGVFRFEDDTTQCLRSLGLEK